MLSDPPDASAVCLAISSPRPVDPPPLAPRRTGSCCAKPGPSSRTRQDGAAAWPRLQPDGEARALRRVREDVAEQRVQAGAEFGLGHTHHERSAPRCRAASRGPDPRPALPRTPRAASSPRPRRSCRARCCRACARPRSGTSRRLSSACTCWLSLPSGSAESAMPSSSSRSAVSGVLSRCDRSATDSRSCQISSLIRPARWLSPLASSRTSGGPAGLARASSPPAASRCDTRASSLIGLVTVPTSRFATDDADGQQEQAEPGQDQPRLRDALGQLGVADEGADDGRSAMRQALHRDKDLPASRVGTVKLAAAARRAARRRCASLARRAACALAGTRSSAASPPGRASRTLNGLGSAATSALSARTSSFALRDWRGPRR